MWGSLLAEPHASGTLCRYVAVAVIERRSLPVDSKQTEHLIAKTIAVCLAIGFVIWTIILNAH